MQNSANTSPASIGSNPIQLLEKASSQQSIESEFRFSLGNSLTHSLEFTDILSHFYQMLCKAVDCNGMGYQATPSESEIMLGKRRAHTAKYSLKLDDFLLGDITFFGARRFEEIDLNNIESLLGILIPPLRNAHLYRDAVNKSLHDPLTQVGNRAAMEIALRRELKLAQRNNQPVSLLMLDIDYFKKINDTYGHQGGDHLLVNMAQTLKEKLRETDQIFRYGGEEFVALLSNTTHYDAMVIADRMRTSVKKGNLSYDGQKISVSISIGVSTGHDSLDQNDLIRQADKALYYAKTQGRDRVESARLTKTKQINNALTARDREINPIADERYCKP